MILRYPAYFESFSCLAECCPDSCCKEWEVQVDDQTATRYDHMGGSLGTDLRKFLYRDQEGDCYLRIVDGRCPMWRQDGLCRIQAQLGHDALCQTCRDFPRLTHDYGDFVERGLELSCPEAARLILNGSNTSWIQNELPAGEEPDYDRADMEILLKTRGEVLSILEDDRYPVEQTLALALIYGYHAQSLLDGADAVWEKEKSLNFAKKLAKFGEIDSIIRFYAGLDVLTDAWKKRLEQPKPSQGWDVRLRKMARYGVERYWLQAISDFDLAGRAKMVVLSCLLLHYLGGDLVETAQLYAKEIENSADNVETILDAVYENPALTDDKILGLLLR